jgi:hypothetical protein
MKPSSPSFRMRWLFNVLFLVLAPAWCANAGLVIVVNPAIDARSVTDLAIDQGNLVVVHLDASKSRRIKIIELPPGILHRLADWAQRGPCGPVVISGDSGFMTGLLSAGFQRSQLEYYPPYLDPQLGKTLRDYDQYAVQVALGWLPRSGLDGHPLASSKGAEMLPAKRLEWLLRPDNKSSDAILYRRLAAQYLAPPGIL